MTVVQKIDYLINELRVSSKKFCKDYGIQPQLLWQWRKNLIIPTEKDILRLCTIYKLDPVDFLDPKSSISNGELKPGEHHCAVISTTVDNGVYEDFPREDNGRYEEKD